MKSKSILACGPWSLNPYRIQDIRAVVSLRNEAASHGTIPPIPSQLVKNFRWWLSSRLSSSQFNFVVKHATKGTVGFVAIYSVNSDSGEWGRWVIKPGTLGAIPSLYLICEFGFRDLGLSELTCLTFASNKAVVELHERLGFQRFGVEWRNERRFVRHKLLASAWSDCSPSLKMLAERVR